MYALKKEKIYGLCFGIMIILLLGACGSQNGLIGHWVFEGEAGNELTLDDDRVYEKQ